MIAVDLEQRLPLRLGFHISDQVKKLNVSDQSFIYT